MKSLAALTVFLLFSSLPAPAQHSGSGHSGSGHSGGSAGHSGGVGGGYRGGGGSIGVRGGYGYSGYRGGAILPYYSFVPSFGFGYSSGYPGSVSDYGYGGYAIPAPDVSGGYAQQPAQPPVIINQTFVNGAPAPPPQYGNGDGQPADPTIDEGPRLIQAPAPTPQDWAMSEGRYYLIAYKDHSVYTALAYWMEGGALHYVTPQNAHNQVSLDLLDLDLTKKLNTGRGLGFNIQGK